MELKSKSSLPILLLGLIRPTYYSPPNNNRTHLVFEFYGMQNDSSSPQDIAEENVTDAVAVDENGWALFLDGSPSVHSFE
ncbi:hypothetical protein INT47_005463 [Mucor saturninus]|uniref:Uncharacterized protein n=1 Tax=Mucor saturninus TaxID=64648 RepID=A0A8H7RDH4_9FUNG|nr:hypothetical protein INT47_005463 [Mucor saturninus]